ncbi:MAG: PQQ-binding-like beta-propeller repeat protein [Thermoleophilia bacterium]
MSRNRQPHWRRIILVVAVLGVVLGVGGWFAYAQLQPTEISGNTTEEYIAAVTTEAATTTVAPVAMPWPMYGFDPGRSHWNPYLHHRPPYTQEWVFHALSLVEFPPVVADGRLFVANLHGHFFAIEAATGKRLWHKPTGHCSAASPAVVDGIVYAAFQQNYPCPKEELNGKGFVVAWDAATGRQIWSVETPSIETSPLVVDGSVYVADWAGVVFAFDAKTGALQWKTPTDSQITSSPTYADASQTGSTPAVVVGTNAGSVYEFDAKTGAIRWRSQSLDRLGSGREYFYATPTVAYGRVFIGNTDGWMYAYGAKTGKLMWAKAAGTYVYTAAVAADNVIYIGTYDGFIIAFDAGTGNELWRASVPGVVHGAPTLMDGLLYFSTCGGCGQHGLRYGKPGKSGTYALDIATHKIVWSFPDGQYSPIVADNERVYLAGKGLIYGLRSAP